MRGFWADERVDGGLWPQSNPVFGAVYRYFKKREQQLVADADAIVTLTHASLEEMSRWPGFQSRRKNTQTVVIPCCVDTELFQRAGSPDQSPAGDSWRARLDIDSNAKVVTYLGSLGTWYLVDEMLGFFAQLARLCDRHWLLVMTPDDPSIVSEAAASAGVDPARIRVISVDRSDVPSLLAESSASLFFIKPSYSKMASSPTKLAEIMSLGIPVVANTGVGDVDRIIEDARAGILVQSLDVDGYRDAAAALERFEPDPVSIRRYAMDRFSLSEGISAYERIYTTLLKDSD